jgi:hypothetical protein
MNKDIELILKQRAYIKVLEEDIKVLKASLMRAEIDRENMRIDAEFLFDKFNDTRKRFQELIANLTYLAKNS